MSGGGDRLLKCDGWCNGQNPVTHIGSKGYAYCAECGKERRESGYESTRRMRAWELAELRAGRALPSYTVRPKPEPEAATLTPYDTGEMLEPKLYTVGVTRDDAADFGKVDFDNAEGSTVCTIYAHPSTIDQDTTLVQIDTLTGGRFKIMLNDGELYNGDPEMDDVEFSCAECGTRTATTYVVTTLTPGDRTTRTEVCRDCDDALTRDETGLEVAALAEVAFAAAEGDSSDAEIAALTEALNAALAALGIAVTR